jgi:outer membrane protein assembly factor BamD (BamD/ComL family)
MRAGIVLAWICALLTVAGCGGSSHGTQTPAQKAASYAGAVRALRSGDFDAAITGFRSLGTYRHADRRLLEARRVAGEQTLANARRKLRDGHPRAAVALAQTATARYGYASSGALAFLRRAERAQAEHHRLQLAAKRAGRKAG